MKAKSDRAARLARRRAMFDAGAAAFARVFPNPDASAATPPVYVCPLCIRAFPLAALDEDNRDNPDSLTEEHVPPKSMRGRPILLTCRRCNNHAGHRLDPHMLKADRPAEILRGEARGGHLVRLRVNDGPSIVVRLSGSPDGGFLATGHDNADPPEERRRFLAELDRMAAERSLDWSFKADFYNDAHNARLADVGWLRAAYLTAFAAFGYSYACGPGLAIVRQQIDNPDAPLIQDFHKIDGRSKVTMRRLGIVAEPAELVGVAVHIGWHVTFLPRPDDVAFFTRARPARGRFGGAQIDWPTKARYAFDRNRLGTATVRPQGETIAGDR